MLDLIEYCRIRIASLRLILTRKLAETWKFPFPVMVMPQGSVCQV